MAIKVTVGPPVYNKAPKPSKIPLPSLFPTKLLLPNGDQAFISIPIPDKLYFAGEVLPKHFSQNDLMIEEFAPSLMSALASGLVGDVKKTVKSGKTYRVVQLLVGPNAAPVWFELKNAAKGSKAVHRLIVQLNPNRMSEEGTFDLLHLLHHQTGLGFKVGEYLADARISRIDIAVDVLGVRVSDLLASVENAGKEVLYKGADGSLETMAIHRKQKVGGSGELSPTAQLRPLGDQLLKVYDKRRELISKNIPPPYGEAPLTRIEVSKRRFGNMPCKFVNLANLKNPFVRSKVGLIMSADPSRRWSWIQYVDAVRASGPDRAAFVCDLKSDTRKEFEMLLAQHPSDILDASEIWLHWEAALARAGLQYMIEAAEQLSAGVPLPLD